LLGLGNQIVLGSLKEGDLFRVSKGLIRVILNITFLTDLLSAVLILRIAVLVTVLMALTVTMLIY
jgi:hypothetical protein